MKTRAYITNLPSLRSRAGFTMAEIAISLGVIAFALIAIIGILPAGLQTQRDNREETIINQDARLIMQAIRTGGRDVISDLGSFVIITNDQNNNPVPVKGIPTAVLIQLLSDPFRNHTIVFSAVSGAIASRGGEINDPGFHYQVVSTVASVTEANAFDSRLTNIFGGAAEFIVSELTNQVHEMRLRFAWPVKPNGDLGSEANRYVVRSLITGWYTNGVIFSQEYVRPAP